MSAKVRQLDLAKSRVAECQQRVHDLIDLKRCSEGVTTALQVPIYCVRDLFCACLTIAASKELFSACKGNLALTRQFGPYNKSVR